MKPGSILESKIAKTIKIVVMKKLYLIILFVACKVSLAQSYELLENDTINYVDANNLKQGKWVVKNSIKKLPGYKDDQVVEEGHYKDSKKTGIWKQFFPSGKTKNEITFTNNRPSGYAKFYYENGGVQEEGQWENNRWIGQYKMYYENGQLYYEWKYNEQGKREGAQKYYHPNGKVMIEGDWKEGKESGVVKEYHADGSIKSEKNFADGKLDETSVKNYESKGGAVEPKKEEPKKEEPKKEEPKKEEPKVIVDTQKGNEKPGYISDGFHKLYNKNRQVEKEGEFKNSTLWDGKIYEYEGDKVVKTSIIKGGKVVEVKTGPAK